MSAYSKVFILLFANAFFSFYVLSQLAITCSKLTIETLEQGVWHSSGVFIVNFEQISHLALVFLLLTLSR